MDGIYAVYKPKGPTSHDVINWLRRETEVKKIGHAGTLDPLASGVLVVGVGREATKKLGQIVKKEKEYIAVIKLGETSTTDDAEGLPGRLPAGQAGQAGKEKKILEGFRKHDAPASRICKGHKVLLSKNDVLPERGGSGFPGLGSGRLFISASSPTTERRGIRGFENKTVGSEIPSFEDIQKVVAKFKGQVLQTPPIYSAVKVNGVPAYKLARRGQQPKLKPRQVEIKEIEVLKYEWPYLKLRVVTGPGVYIRALARDIGKELKTGAYLAELERTRVGDFTKENARKVEGFR
jgi:tRNA U55 pseudouridine synthase TruB